MIYILACEEGKYYVGITTDIEKRFDEHNTGHGALWTRKYKPLYIFDIIDSDDLFDEIKYTCIMMQKYGIENVRGGCFVSIKLPIEDTLVITKIIRSLTNKCFTCGEEHFSLRCTVVCTLCNKTGHYIENCNMLS